MHRLILKCAALAAFTLGTSISVAQEAAPDVVVKTATSEVLRLLKQPKDDADPLRASKLDALVESRIVPLFHFRRMAEIAVGPSWSQATPDQRDALTAEFRTLLLRTYAAALRAFGDQTITFKPLDVAPGAVEATVQSVVSDGDASRLPIDYYMEKTADGWKVYEISIDGMKLIQNYRGTFASRVRTGGVEGLIKVLSDRNRQSD